MEKELKIRTVNRKSIYGTLGITNKKSHKLVIFVHGFTGHQNEHIFFNGAKFFTEKGFDTFRLNLYGDLYGKGDKSRHFRDTYISLHGKDITTVAKFFRKKYKKIFVIGHSYGGTSLLFTDQSFIDGYVFWDASYINSKDSTANMKFNKNIDGYILDWGMEYIVGKRFVEELKNFLDCKDLIKEVQKPVLFITAGNRGNSKAGIKYFENANQPKKLINIKTADHNFNKWEDEEKLLKNTYIWLKQF